MGGDLVAQCLSLAWKIISLAEVMRIEARITLLLFSRMVATSGGLLFGYDHDIFASLSIYLEIFPCPFF
ncbi:hypothetical protein IEQ34_015291 [Dendrobium chrysotoxum]|uniref:Uncharacterized protein n=1 Tax=Dendrobium chrysotoxum TaxID=161865 RepID=A0AAV7GHC1_DENCH|nr:hypothetical protein IEQ34_015291 [Dendrobium chrysotoxum]